MFRKCPVPIGFYYAYNLTLNGIDLPPIMRHYLGSKDTKLVYDAFAKAPDKKIYKICNLNFWAGYKNNA